jgi:hypothetical protein
MTRGETVEVARPDSVSVKCSDARGDGRSELSRHRETLTDARRADASAGLSRCHAAAKEIQPKLAELIAAFNSIPLATADVRHCILLVELAPLRTAQELAAATKTRATLQAAIGVNAIVAIFGPSVRVSFVRRAPLSTGLHCCEVWLGRGRGRHPAPT